MSTEPVWIIDHDIEDQDIVKLIWQELDLDNDLVFFTSGEQAFERLAEVQRAPFMIICELNLPGLHGFALRKKLLDTHSKKFKSVPFIFWSSHVTEEQITQAYDLAVHGLFIKEGAFDDLKDTFSIIVRYWLKSKIPAKTEKPKE